jgi:hypothetical protein
MHELLCWIQLRNVQIVRSYPPLALQKVELYFTLLWDEIAACRAPLPHTFTAVSTFTGHSKRKCLLTLKTRFYFLKSEGPLN